MSKVYEIEVEVSLGVEIEVEDTEGDDEAEASARKQIEDYLGKMERESPNILSLNTDIVVEAIDDVTS